MLTTIKINKILEKLPEFEKSVEIFKLESLSIYLPDTDDEIESIHFAALGSEVKILTLSLAIKKICDFDFFVLDQKGLKDEIKQKILQKKGAAVIAVSNKTIIENLLTQQLGRQTEKQNQNQGEERTSYGPV